MIAFAKTNNKLRKLGKMARPTSKFNGKRGGSRLAAAKNKPYLIEYQTPTGSWQTYTSYARKKQRDAMLLRCHKSPLGQQRFRARDVKPSP